MRTNCLPRLSADDTGRQRVDKKTCKNYNSKFNNGDVFHNIMQILLNILRKHSGSVVECLDCGFRASPASLCCVLEHCLVLVQQRKNRPDITRDVDWDVKNQIIQK